MWKDASIKPDVPRFPDRPNRKSDGTQLISLGTLILQLESGEEIEGYYHAWHGWMTKGAPVGDFIYGYIPANGVVKWRKK